VIRLDKLTFGLVKRLINKKKGKNPKYCSDLALPQKHINVDIQNNMVNIEYKNVCKKDSLIFILCKSDHLLLRNVLPKSVMLLLYFISLSKCIRKLLNKELLYLLSFR